MSNYSAVIPFSIDSLQWRLGVVMSEQGLTEIDYLNDSAAQACFVDAKADGVASQLDDYFQGRRQQFTLPLVFTRGTPFQRKVWQALCDIPYGSTMTYGELATKLGSGPRAIGAACRCNPIPIVVPCHRVIAASGLGGYSGETGGAMRQIKQYLITLERTAGA